ncbi:Na(+)/H(+) antiporter 1 [Coccidioides immitis RMSCC 3703]|uniref:Na(+)/H(+) antiporter 1 n=2 Tax=Coccidioides immitis TaxID=5501 RepID=A0A0J8QMV8_COCIT|nr:Na(+)/H(+) antiporter 1 [Coccidioides immitis RMSCC 2394]KMU73801.1 Na(+)/H(+) antiporter 1 [Coccidioides immitis RMSCC 3703]
MPTLDVSELNIVLSVLGAFTLLYGFISSKIKNVWYLGEALPAVVFGIVLGPIASKFIDAERWGVAVPGQQNAITLKWMLKAIFQGLTRVVIGVQLVIAGYQLPAKYLQTRWKEMLICLLPIMTIMWLCTTGCILLTIPKLTLLTALVIGSCVTCTDPILSQAIAKGPFADKFVARDLREIISSEAGANDGFGFPFLMLATYLIRHANVPGAGDGNALHARSGEVGRLGGGVGKAIEMWFVETWLYVVLMSIAYGAVCGYGSCKLLKFCLRRRWIDNESYLLWPSALGLFIVGTCGSLGTDDLLACFIAGSALNWDGGYLKESEARHDEVNSCIDVLLNFGGFMYIGSILPWDEFHQPDVTGITYPRLIALGFLVMAFRRLPAILLAYKFIPKVCKSWKEALFMGYYGPIGIGAVFYLEHARHLFPELGEGDTEETNLIRALAPTVYWLVLFSIIFHGLSIPLHNLINKALGVPPIVDPSGPAELRPLSLNMQLPKNSAVSNKRQSIMAYNRFSRTNYPSNTGWDLPTTQGVDYEAAYARQNRPQTLRYDDDIKV